VLAFWFGESDEVTPGHPRAAVQALQAGRNLLFAQPGPAELRAGLAAYASRCMADRCRPRGVTSSGRERADAGDADAGGAGRRGGGGGAGLAQPDGTAGDPGCAGRRVSLHPRRRLDVWTWTNCWLPSRRHAGADRQRAQQPHRLDAEPRGEQAILEHCRRTGTWIVSDEVYERLYFATAHGLRRRFLDVAEPPTTGCWSRTASPRAF
jgi:hypothetical protein